ncbi:MAG: hypothetical protein COA71_05445 [SAR86 cluster bacterium]|uniref:Uncharacterized protein n=1 Tax=SAR86 cluster bacterium TaxID=2030880 RepID=A0A2A5CHD9_9GAMM|nr:MAG: hypothetical protein COA71_05445 [SAR86 cluster bacterium]
MNKQFLQVFFLAIMLLGIQAVQSSALHDHVAHQVDCVLCHFDSHDQDTLAQADITFAEAQQIRASVFAEPDYFSFLYPSYQSRSPPRFYS